MQFHIITGTSVGAIHACFLASTLGAPGTGALLAEIWRSLSLGDVYRMGISDFLRAPSANRATRSEHDDAAVNGLAAYGTPRRS